jgi:hypothetical protein
MRTLLCLIGCLATATVLGCASSGTDSPGADSASDDRPRVDGTWRIVTTSLDREAREDRFTWSVTPECATGPCGFRVSSKTTGNKFRFSFDKAIGDYLRNYRLVDNCVNQSTGALIAKNGYRVSIKSIMRVTDSVISEEDGVDYATQMSGEDREEVRLTPEAEAAGCSSKGRKYSVLAIRLDKPAGEPGSAAPQVPSGAEGFPPGE